MHRTARLRLAAAGLAAATVAGVLGVLPASPARAASTTTSGVNGGAASTFGGWRGSTVTAVNNFMPHATWAQMQNPVYGGPPEWKSSKGVLIEWAVTMFPDSNNGATLQAGASGAYNQYFLGMAQSLVANNQGNAIIRLGWEMNGDWFSWSGTKDPASFVAYWKQIVNTMRSVPGANFKFLWSPADGTTFDPALLYPGDAYVDMVGMSVYDESMSVSQSQAVARWSEMYYGLSGVHGLDWLVKFSADHNKPMGFGEWGVAIMCDGSGGGDDPYFIQKMHDFFADNNVVFEAYFNIDPASCEKHALTDGSFPQAAAMYKKLFSQPFVPGVWDTTSGRPATSSDTLVLSVAPDRRTPLALDGANLDDGAYIWAAPASSQVYKVQFYLDGATTPMHTETTAPFDLVGGSATNALVWDTTGLAAGTHTLRAALTARIGSVDQTTSSTATFTVRTPAAASGGTTSTPPASSTPVSTPPSTAPVSTPPSSAPVSPPPSSAPVSTPPSSAPVSPPPSSAPVSTPPSTTAGSGSSSAPTGGSSAPTGTPTTSAPATPVRRTRPINLVATVETAVAAVLPAVPAGATRTGAAGSATGAARGTTTAQGAAAPAAGTAAGSVPGAVSAAGVPDALSAPATAAAPTELTALITAIEQGLHGLPAPLLHLLIALLARV